MMKKHSRNSTWYLIKYLPVLFFFFSSCCTCKKKGLYLDKLEVTAIIGFGPIPKCVCPQPFMNLENIICKGCLNIKKNEEFTVWVKAVYFDNFGKGKENLKIELNLINNFGTIVDSSLNGTEFFTDNRGFNKNKIKLKITSLGVYRIRASYNDKQSVSVSYSPFIFVGNLQ